ncbi:LidE [Legionella rubrilucens]|uniref:LidE n=1 Tax=Legionella rubrilucens TaxID=458 RepID=A0A0W0Y0N0_9GAMM|nr:hypothetical protein [Legionella rubrilucens]KTD50539.1 LidE [Legionella rubrilucens]
MEDNNQIKETLDQEKKECSNLASSPDRLQDFNLNKQGLWLQHSQAIIEELSQHLPDYPQKKPALRSDIRCPEDVLLTKTGCAYAFLASKRREIAKLLKHSPLRHQFGLFNKAGFIASDDFKLTDLRTQKETIYKQLMDLISRPQDGVTIQKRAQERGTIYIIEFQLTPEDAKRQHNENAKSTLPFIEDTTDLTIIFSDYGIDDAKTTLQIDHHMTPFSTDYRNESSYFYVQFVLIEPYLRACLAWTDEQPVQDFLSNAGRIAYSLAHRQLVGRGNSAIVEWLIRGLAKNRGIELGPFNHNENIGWDFKAFLTPNCEEYADWFAKKAFAVVKIQETGQFLPGKK